VKSFSRDIQTSKPPDTVRTEALTSLTEPLARYDYVLTTQSESGLTFARKYRPWWVWVLAVVTFPIGLFLLFITNTATVTVVLKPEKSGPSSALRASANRRSVRLSSPWSCSRRLTACRPRPTERIQRQRPAAFYAKANGCFSSKAALFSWRSTAHLQLLSRDCEHESSDRPVRHGADDSDGRVSTTHRRRARSARRSRASRTSWSRSGPAGRLR
jgi:hypothetical protein